jgi:hypothetical protein
MLANIANMQRLLAATTAHSTSNRTAATTSCHCWQVYYTLNGELVGQGYARPAAQLAATLFPAVGLHTPGVQAVFNFGNNTSSSGSSGGSSSSSSSARPFMFDASTAAAKLAPAAVAAKSDTPTASATAIEQVRRY